jgi:oligoendopeptidase F
MRENAIHTKRKEENIITVKDSNGVDALLDLRELIETEQRYEVDLEDGKGMRVIETQAELMGHTRSIDPRVRENTYRALFAAFEKNIDKYQLIYQSIVKDWGEDARLRGYATPIAMRNHANHVPDGAIETLMSVCSGNLGVFHDFFKVKASLMGIEKLRRFDLYAPLGEAESHMIMLVAACERCVCWFSVVSP